MKITMVAAISEDGFLTKGTNPNPGDWTSDEDKDFYKSLLEKNNLYLLGNKTFSLTKNTLPYHAEKIVMSQNVHNKLRITGVHYSDKSFRETLDRFSNHSDLLVLGGASIYHQMLEQNLIDEAFITIEPVCNKTGILLSSSKNYFENLGFELISEETLNPKGTILKHYVLKK